MAASKLAALQEEYEEKFENQPSAGRNGQIMITTLSKGALQEEYRKKPPSCVKMCRFDVELKAEKPRSQQLQVALQNKERIEKEKQEAPAKSRFHAPFSPRYTPRASRVFLSHCFTLWPL